MKIERTSCRRPASPWMCWTAARQATGFPSGPRSPCRSLLRMAGHAGVPLCSRTCAMPHSGSSGLARAEEEEEQAHAVLLTYPAVVVGQVLQHREEATGGKPRWEEALQLAGQKPSLVKKIQLALRRRPLGTLRREDVSSSRSRYPGQSCCSATRLALRSCRTRWPCSAGRLGAATRVLTWCPWPTPSTLDACELHCLRMTTMVRSSWTISADVASPRRRVSRPRLATNSCNSGLRQFAAALYSSQDPPSGFAGSARTSAWRAGASNRIFQSS
mmetsp:Transcript_2566/g.6424  ORF Transcript_2566/g.6424 Transcript_2566/m.6424 type:complete len:273 (+) Transcript_2566:884-1702(+)